MIDVAETREFRETIVSHESVGESFEYSRERKFFSFPLAKIVSFESKRSEPLAAFEGK